MVSNRRIRKVEVNIILPRMNIFYRNQKVACDICFIIYPHLQTKLK